MKCPKCGKELGSPKSYFPIGERPLVGNMSYRDSRRTRSRESVAVGSKMRGAK